MDFNKYIKELVRNQVQKSEHLQRTKGIIESINGNKITIKLISSIDQPSVTIVNNNGLELSVGQNVTINHWGDVSKGYISFNSFEKFGGGVGQWLPIDPDNTTEIFNDYKDNGIVVSDVNETLTGYSYNPQKHDFYSHIAGVYNHIYVDAPSVHFSDIRLVGRANQLHLGGSTSSSTINCEGIYISGEYNNVNLSYQNTYQFSLIGGNNVIQLNNGYGSNECTIIGGRNQIEALGGFQYCNVSGQGNEISTKANVNQLDVYGSVNRISVTSSYFDNTVFLGRHNKVNLTGYNHIDDLQLVGTGNHIDGILTENSYSNISYNSLLGAANSIYLSNSNCLSSILTGYSNAINLYNSCGADISILGTCNNVSSYIGYDESVICGYYNEIEINQSAANRYKYIDFTSLFGCANSLKLGSDGGTSLVLLGVGNSIESTGYASWQSVIGTGAQISYANNAQASDISIAFSGNYMTLSKSNGGNLSVGGSITSNGADYAEDWEWADGNNNNEDRRGLFVTIADDGYHIKIANKDDEILGIVSSNPSVVGGGDNFEWRGKYLKDVFGDYIYEDVQVPITTQERKLVKDEYTDDDGIHHPPEYETIEVETGEYRTEKRRVLNPNYDDTLVYTNREYRSEHCYIAHLGKVVMVDDGTAEPNGYVTSADGGIATKSETKTRARVLQRLDDNHIRVWWE